MRARTCPPAGLRGLRRANGSALGRRRRRRHDRPTWVIVEWQKRRCYNWIMLIHPTSHRALSDADLLLEATRAAAGERSATARLIAVLAEVDTRRLYLGEGCSSLFIYCTRVLHLSEHAAYGRIEAARVARRFPLVLALLDDGAVTVTAVSLLAPHLNASNHHELLMAARHKSKRDVEHIVAAVRPQPDAPLVVRRLPAPAGRHPSAPASVSCPGAPGAPPSASEMPPGPPVAPPSRPPVVTPMAPERYKVQFTASGELYRKIRRAQDLIRHVAPDADVALVIDRAVTLLVADLERKKLAAVTRPKAGGPAAPGTRHIAAAVKRAVWARDAGRCAFVGTAGRCTETGRLEFHHVVPFAEGGEATVGNLGLRCRAHNLHEAALFFGPPLDGDEVWPECTEGQADSHQVST
jgi:hypothetical protein